MQRVYMIQLELTLHAGVVLPNGEFASCFQPTSVDGEFHLTWKGVDVQTEGLNHNAVNACFAELPLDELTGFADTI